MSLVTRRAIVLGSLVAVAAAPAWAQADKPVRIGFSMARTGLLAVATPPQLNTYELWRDQVNAAGGLDVGGTRRKVEFVTNYTAPRGATAQITMRAVPAAANASWELRADIGPLRAGVVIPAHIRVKW